MVSSTLPGNKRRERELREVKRKVGFWGRPSPGALDPSSSQRLLGAGAGREGARPQELRSRGLTMPCSGEGTQR